MLWVEFLFYKYVFLVNQQPPDVIPATTFNQQRYESILQEWQLRQESFNDTSGASYENPFK